ncbi:MAG: trypsin-like peptidase domain-containing protein [Patescibacteria group bacterium]
MFCHNCGSKIKDTAKFCHNCGTTNIQEGHPTILQPIRPETKSSIKMIKGGIYRCGNCNYEGPSLKKTLDPWRWWYYIAIFLFFPILAIWIFLDTGLKNVCPSCNQRRKLKRLRYELMPEQKPTDPDTMRNRFHRNFAAGILILLIIFGVIGSLIDEETDTTTISNTAQTSNKIANNSNDTYNQSDVIASIVNIYCPSTVPGEEMSGGSGTIITDDGMILTNAHIVPQDETFIHVDETGCMVILPDVITGQPNEIYLAHPIVLPDLSDRYDLAFMEIYAAYYDEEKSEYAGAYPRKFPNFDDGGRCQNENVKLGETVRIFGYPAIGGGYSLTITDGIVSSFPGDDLIITSAKISYGNSGGLAVDKNGCMIGVPSMVNSDELESLGVIISTNLLNSFTDEVETYIASLE